MATEDLSREIILDHYQNPRNHGRLEHPTLANRGHNPLCGDEIEVSVEIDGQDEVISAILFTGRGCSISQASASMMTEMVKGHTLDEAEASAQKFTSTMADRKSAPGELEDELDALQGVKRYPARVKCALLPWTTLRETVDLYRHRERSAADGDEAVVIDCARRAVTRSDTELMTMTDTEATETLPSEDDVRLALKSVYDPEIGISIIDLGLVYGVQVDDDSKNVLIDMTLTTPACPLGPIIKTQAHAVITNQFPSVNDVDINLVWTPRWDPRIMASEEAKAELGIW